MEASWKEKDCRNCIRRGDIRDGKVECRIGGIVEPIDGKYPYARDCVSFEDIYGNTNEEPKNCPLCGGKVVMYISSDGTTISCPKCDLLLGKRCHLTTAGAIRAWNRRA